MYRSKMYGSKVSSRKHQGSLAAALLLVAGTAVVPPSQAATGWGGSHHAGPPIQESAPDRSFVEAVKSLWALFGYDLPRSPAGDDGNGHHGHDDEGTGICPHGHM
jgi:hypothetical protein